MNEVFKLETLLSGHEYILKKLETISSQNQAEKAHLLQIKIQEGVIEPIEQAIVLTDLIEKIGIRNIPFSVLRRWKDSVRKALLMVPPIWRDV